MSDDQPNAGGQKAEGLAQHAQGARTNDEDEIVRAMSVRGYWLLLVVAAWGCDSNSKTSPGGAGNFACVLGSESEPESEFYLLPVLYDAKKLDEGIKSRQRGTVNLLLAKYHNKLVSGGTKCVILEEKEGYARIKAKPGGLTGWVPVEQIRGGGK